MKRLTRLDQSETQLKQDVPIKLLLPNKVYDADLGNPAAEVTVLRAS